MRVIAIIGLGLIGGSLGLALKRGLGGEIELVGYARRPETAARALDLGAVDRAELDLRKAVDKAEAVILATPVMAMKEILSRIRGHLSPGSVVTDTASTKVAVLSWAGDSLPAGTSFVGGHPMAGKESSGLEAAEAGLFDGCLYCLVPQAKATPEAIETVVGLVERIGARPYFTDAEGHDKLMAGISHLPLLLSAALVSATTKDPSWPKMARLAASGYRDLTRLASGDPEMSRDICLTNRAPIMRWIDEFVQELQRFRHLVSQGDGELGEAFIQARQAREKWLYGEKDRL